MIRVVVVSAIHGVGEGTVRVVAFASHPVLALDFELGHKACAICILESLPWALVLDDHCW